MRNTGERFDWQAMVIVTILMLFGIGMIYFTWGNMAVTVENFYNYFYKEGLIFIFALFFIGVGVYCWYLFITNFFITPNNEIMFLKDIDEAYYNEDGEISIILTFINNKGKVYFKTVNAKQEYKINSFYEVVKTNSIIKEIIRESNENFKIVKEKKSYWLNWYSPIGNFENIFLLPILYVMFLPGFFSFILSDGFAKIYGFIFGIIPLSLIIYDLIYKINHR